MCEPSSSIIHPCRSEAGEEATAQALLDFQAVLPTLDHRLGLDGQSVGSGATGPQFSIVVRSY